MNILTYIETFAVVAEKGSFTAAAETLGISKPVVSKRISQLEKHLGVLTTSEDLTLNYLYERIRSWQMITMYEKKRRKQRIIVCL